MRTRWQHQTRELLEAVTTWETAEGRFHDVLDDATTFTDGTAGLMFAYTAFTGVADGWLGGEYTQRAERWLTAALAQVGADGLVRGVAGAPHFTVEGHSAEAQAFALMALAAAERCGR